ncbi:MAG TPA: hypothetical protein VF365_11640 [Candidatus Limnocylindria bacterium]
MTHALLLREARTAAADPVAAVLTDVRLSTCFGAQLRVARMGDRRSVSAA